MTTENKMSRRDWFRLKSPKSPVLNQWLGKQSETSKVSQGLQPVELPPNHDGMDLAELPPMREAFLSVEEIGSLFADIASLATDIQLMQRRQTKGIANVGIDKEKLELARIAFLDGSVAKIQIRYRWQDALWIDTLERKEKGFRLLRIVHAAA